MCWYERSPRSGRYRCRAPDGRLPWDYGLEKLTEWLGADAEIYKPFITENYDRPERKLLPRKSPPTARFAVPGAGNGQTNERPALRGNVTGLRSLNSKDLARLQAELSTFSPELRVCLSPSKAQSGLKEEHPLNQPLDLREAVTKLAMNVLDLRSQFDELRPLIRDMHGKLSNVTSAHNALVSTLFKENVNGQEVEKSIRGSKLCRRRLPTKGMR